MSFQVCVFQMCIWEGQLASVQFHVTLPGVRCYFSPSMNRASGLLCQLQGTQSRRKLPSCSEKEIQKRNHHERFEIQMQPPPPPGWWRESCKVFLLLAWTANLDVAFMTDSMNNEGTGLWEKRVAVRWAVRSWAVRRSVYLAIGPEGGTKIWLQPYWRF